MNVIPLQDRIIVRRIEEPAHRNGSTNGNAPDSGKEKPQRGRVIAAGTGIPNDQSPRVPPLQVKAGDTVLFGKSSGHEITIGGMEYLIIKHEDVLGVETADSAKEGLGFAKDSLTKESPAPHEKRGWGRQEPRRA